MGAPEVENVKCDMSSSVRENADVEDVEIAETTVRVEDIRTKEIFDDPESQTVTEDACALSPKQARRAHRKAVKTQQRSKREQLPDAVVAKNKPCGICGRLVDLLVRCTHDSSGKWSMLCGRCWKAASGGVPDGDADHPYYRYGGLWKNVAADSSKPSFRVHAMSNYQVF